MKDLGYTFKYVYNIIGKPSRVDEVLSFCKAESIQKQTQSPKIGF